MFVRWMGLRNESSAGQILTELPSPASRDRPQLGPLGGPEDSLPNPLEIVILPVLESGRGEGIFPAF